MRTRNTQLSLPGWRESFNSITVSPTSEESLQSVNFAKTLCKQDREKEKESKTNLVRTRDGFSTPAVSLKLTGPHTASLIKYPGRQLQEAIISCLCRCKVASSSSRLFGTPSSFSLQPLLLLMATPGAFPSCSQKLKNWDSKLNRLFPA